MREYPKAQAESIVIAIHKSDHGWSGAIVVNGDAVSECNGGSAEIVLDAVWDGAFNDSVGGDALYKTR